MDGELKFSIKYILPISLIGIFIGILSVLIGGRITFNPILFWISMFLSVAIIPQIFKGISKQFDPLSIDFLFVCGFTVYSLTEPIRVLMNLSYYPTDSVISTLILETLALLFFYMGFWYNRVGKKSESNEMQLNKSHLKTITLLITGGIAMLAVYFTAVGAFSGLSKMQISQSKGDMGWVSSLLFGFKFLNVSLLSFYLYQVNIGKRKMKGFFIFLLIYFSLSMLIGERGEISILLFSLLIVRHYKVKRIKSAPFFAIGLFGYFAFQTLNYLKGVPIYNMIPHFFKTVKLEWYTSLSGEFQSAARNMFVVVENIPNNVDFLYGSTYLATLANAIPSALWPDRPDSAVGWFNRTFFPGVVSQGGGRGFTLVGEAFVNFGTIGVCAFFLLLGFFCKFLYLKVKFSKSDFWILAYAVFIPVLIYCIRADLTNLSSQFIKGFIIPFLILYFVGEKVRIRKIRRSTQTKHLRNLA